MQEILLNDLTTLSNKIGIYEIIINKKSYIGSSINLKNRLREHLLDLKQNNHNNKKLQNAYNKYQSLTIFILEECLAENLINREEHWYNLKGYYNLQNPKKNKNSQCRVVYKYSLDGKYLCKYNSSAEAARRNNIASSAGISAACYKKTYFASGFLWTYDEEIPFRNNKAFKPVYMFSQDENFIRKFPSSADIARELNCSISVVKQAIKKRCLCKGFLFSYDDKSPILSNNRKNKKCFLKNIDNDSIIKEYSSSKEASIDLKVKITSIYDYLYRKTKINSKYYITY